MKEFERTPPIELRILTDEEFNDVRKGLKNGSLVFETFDDDDNTEIVEELLRNDIFASKPKKTRSNLILKILKVIFALFCYIIVGVLGVIEFVLNIILTIVSSIISYICGIGFTLVTICFLGDLLFQMSENAFYLWLPFYGFFIVLLLIPYIASLLPMLVENIRDFISVHLLS